MLRQDVGSFSQSTGSELKSKKYKVISMYLLDSMLWFHYFCGPFAKMTLTHLYRQNLFDVHSFG